jgi:tRNA pseudouridine38-40 synthase
LDIELRTIKLTLQYDGTEFVGWQRQEQGDSIQGTIEDALARIEGQAVTVHGAGRTDAGVHAVAQVASVHVASSLDDETLARALNANLPSTIRVARVETAAEDFHARFSAVSKTYEYRIWNGPAQPPFLRLYTWHVPQPLMFETLQRGADALVGTHDFAAFQGAGTVVHTTVRTIAAAAWRAEEPLVFEISGDGFLRHMVRSLVGTLVEAGLRRRPVHDVEALLTSPDRSRVGRTAPPSGLFLVRVTY